MKKLLILTLVAYTTLTPVVKAMEIEFTPTSRPKLSISTNTPEVYKPSRLIIGTENSFKVKGEAGSNVTLAVSKDNEGVLYKKQTLRLGKEIETFDSVIPENGIVEISYKTPNDKELDGKEIYFEVLVWKKDDQSDIQTAKIVSSTGRNTNNNKLILHKPVKNPSKINFAPAIPGFSPQMLETMKDIDKIKNNDEKIYSDAMYNSSPAMLRNLRDPSLKKNK